MKQRHEGLAAWLIKAGKDFDDLAAIRARTRADPFGNATKMWPPVNPCDRGTSRRRAFLLTWWWLPGACQIAGVPYLPPSVRLPVPFRAKYQDHALDIHSQYDQVTLSPDFARVQVSSKLSNL